MTTNHSPTRWRWIDSSEWDERVASSPCATPFHTREWCETYAEVDDRYRARALSVSLGEAEVLLPVMVRRGVLRRGPLARAVATQPGVYGGPLSPRGRLGDLLWQEFARALKGLPFGRIDFFGSVLDAPPPALTAELGARMRSTHAIDLATLPDESRSSFSKGCKHALTKARRAGVFVERLRGDANVRDYFEIYRDSLRRWGKTEERSYRRELFDALERTALAELWGARMPDGQLAAGGVFLFTPRHCVWWHGAMNEAFAEASPSNALIHALIDETRRRGCELFDFNPSGGHEGVASFKRSFGPREIEFPIWTHRSRLVARLSRERGDQG